MALVTLIAAGEPEDNFDYDAAVAQYRTRHAASMHAIVGTLTATAVAPARLAQGLGDQSV